MATIAGVTNVARRQDVTLMMEKTAHRGGDKSKTIEKNGAHFQSSWHGIEESGSSTTINEKLVWDGTPPPELSPKSLASWPQPYAVAATRPKGVFLARDPLGVKPLYYGKAHGDMYFASEVKALLPITADINEFPPGHYFTPEKGFQSFTHIGTKVMNHPDVDQMVSGLRGKLEKAIQRAVVADTMGVWLSGGVDSSVIATLAKKQVKELHSFVIGLKNASDIEYGGRVAETLGTRHHAYTVTVEDLLPILPKAIYALESFDALLVRSSVTNYLISGIVSDYVDAVLSGEAGDELFAGYAYMKALPIEELPAAVEEAVGVLHNTAFQRVDRSACAQGILPFVPFADMDVVNYALSIPVEYKIYRHGNAEIEKWILRKTIEGMIPDAILWRPKTKFWQGTGLKELLGDYADEHISDEDFRHERVLPNGWKLNTKEELMYYRIFKEQFGDLKKLDWMGRTKGAPVQ